MSDEPNYCKECESFITYRQHSVDCDVCGAVVHKKAGCKAGFYMGGVTWVVCWSCYILSIRPSAEINLVGAKIRLLDLDIKKFITDWKRECVGGER